MRIFSRSMFVFSMLNIFNLAHAECSVFSDSYSAVESVEGCVYKFNSDNFNSVRFLQLVNLLSISPSDRRRILKFDAGIYLFNKSITYTGPFGWGIFVQGEGANKTKFVFNNAHGVDLEGPVGLGLLDKITLNGQGQKGRVNDPLIDKYGVLARRGATIKLGRDVVVEEFSRAGVQAFMGSSIFANGVISRNNGSDGFVASYNSTVYADSAQSLGNRGVGFFCEASSSIFASNSVSYGALVDREKGQSRGGDGFVAILNGVIVADRSRLHGNEDHDFVALKGGSISAVNINIDRLPRILVKDQGDVFGITH